MSISKETDNVNNDPNISKNKLQELNDLYMLVKKEKQNFMKNEIFINTIIEASIPSNGINEVLGVKIKDIILRGELKNCLQVKKDTISGPEVMLDDFDTLELSYEEQKDLKIALERRIKEKGDLFLKELNEISDDTASNLEELVEHIKFNAKGEQNNLLSLQKQLVEQQKLYIHSLINQGNKLQELIDLKAKTGTEVAEQKATEDVIESERYSLRLKLLHQQTHLSIFEELPLSLDAYKKAINDLKEQQYEATQEIGKIRTDIDNYKIVSKNNEYQEILAEYKQYKRAIENKLWLRSKLNRNT